MCDRASSLGVVTEVMTGLKARAVSTRVDLIRSHRERLLWWRARRALCVLHAELPDPPRRTDHRGVRMCPRRCAARAIPRAQPARSVRGAGWHGRCRPSALGARASKTCATWRGPWALKPFAAAAAQARENSASPTPSRLDACVGCSGGGRSSAVQPREPSTRATTVARNAGSVVALPPSVPPGGSNTSGTSK